LRSCARSIRYRSRNAYTQSDLPHRRRGTCHPTAYGRTDVRTARLLRTNEEPTKPLFDKVVRIQLSVFWCAAVVFLCLIAPFRPGHYLDMDCGTECSWRHKNISGFAPAFLFASYLILFVQIKHFGRSINTHRLGTWYADSEPRRTGIEALGGNSGRRSLQVFFQRIRSASMIIRLRIFACI